MDKLSICTVGELTETECHRETYVSKAGNESFADLSDCEKELLCLRTKKTLNNLKDGTICFHHKVVFLKKIEFFQKTCCDPLDSHPDHVKNKSLHAVSVDTSKKLSCRGIKVKPGQKLCTQCHQVLLSDSTDIEFMDIDYKEEIVPSQDSQMQSDVQHLNVSFTEVGCSPIKLHSIPKHSKLPYGLRKLESFESNVRDKLGKVLKVDISSVSDVNQAAGNDDDMEILCEALKNKLKVVPRSQVIQILTIPAVLKWSRKKITEVFEVPDYAARQAIKLAEEKGILAIPDTRVGKKLNSDIISLVVNHFESDEQSRVMDGMKGVVSVGNKEQERK